MMVAITSFRKDIAAEWIGDGRGLSHLIRLADHFDEDGNGFCPIGPQYSTLTVGRVRLIQIEGHLFARPGRLSTQIGSASYAWLTSVIKQTQADATVLGMILILGGSKCGETAGLEQICQTIARSRKPLWGVGGHCVEGAAFALLSHCGKAFGTDLFRPGTLRRWTCSKGAIAFKGFASDSLVNGMAEARGIEPATLLAASDQLRSASASHRAGLIDAAVGPRREAVTALTSMMQGIEEQRDAMDQKTHPPAGSVRGAGGIRVKNCRDS